MMSIATERNTPVLITKIDVPVKQLIDIQCKVEISNLTAQST